MAPKRKDIAGIVAELTAKPKQNGGRGRGQGKKPSAVNAKGQMLSQMAGKPDQALVGQTCGRIQTPRGSRCHSVAITLERMDRQTLKVFVRLTHATSHRHMALPSFTASRSVKPSHPSAVSAHSALKLIEMCRHKLQILCARHCGRALCTQGC